jgi:alginate O-acetyltransferase complex protein AlgI
MFGLLHIPFFSYESMYHLKSYGILFLMGGIGATPIVAHMIPKFITHMKGAKWLGVLEAAALGFLYLLSTSYLVDSSFNPFLYFRF